MANYRQAVISALPGLQSLDGVQTRHFGADFTPEKLQERALGRQNVNRPPPGLPVHAQPQYHSDNQLSYWEGRMGTGPPGLQAWSERAASGAFTSTSFTPTIDHALQGFYRRQQQRGGPRQGERPAFDPPSQTEYRPQYPLTRNGLDNDLGGQGYVPGGVNMGGGEQEESGRTKERQHVAEYEDRIRVLESRLLDLAQKVDREGGGRENEVKRSVSEGALVPANFDGRGVREQALDSLHKDAGFDSVNEVQEEDGISGWKRRKGGEEVAGGSAPPRREARPRTLIHGHGVQEGKNKIVNTGTQRLLALVNERKNKKGAVGVAEVSWHTVWIRVGTELQCCWHRGLEMRKMQERLCKEC